MELEGILAGTLLPSLQAGQLKLFRRYVHLLHKAAQHIVHQILVFLMYLPYLLVALVQLQIGIKDCGNKTILFSPALFSSISYPYPGTFAQ